jgi:sirohydrochlorin ferrochelatase
VPLFVSSYSSVVTSTAYLLGVRAEAPPDLQVYARMDHGAHGGGHEGHAAAATPASDPTRPISCPVPIKMTGALDDHQLVADILGDRAAALSQDPPNEVLILVAHGPNDDSENARWLENMRHLASRLPRGSSYARIEVLTVRDDADEEVRTRATAEFRGLVDKARAENRRALVVPLLLSFGGIETGIRKRLEGLDYAMSGQALLPDPRIARWIIESARSTMPVTKGATS